jgi:hypothetical protein
VCARNWSSVGRGSYFNAHNFQTIGFQPTSYPKETCASQFPPQVTGKWSYPLLGSVTVAGSLRVVTPPTSLDSSPSSCSLRSAKPRRVSPSGSSSTSQGSIVTTFSLGTTDTFHGHSNTSYKHYLQEIHPTAATPEYVSFIDEKVATEEDGVWTAVKV